MKKILNQRKKSKVEKEERRELYGNEMVSEPTLVRNTRGRSNTFTCGDNNNPLGPFYDNSIGLNLLGGGLDYSDYSSFDASSLVGSPIQRLSESPLAMTPEPGKRKKEKKKRITKKRRDENGLEASGEKKKKKKHSSKKLKEIKRLKAENDYLYEQFDLLRDYVNSTLQQISHPTNGTHPQPVEHYDVHPNENRFTSNQETNTFPENFNSLLSSFKKVQEDLSKIEIKLARVPLTLIPTRPSSNPPVEVKTVEPEIEPKTKIRPIVQHSSYRPRVRSYSQIESEIVFKYSQSFINDDNTNTSEGLLNRREPSRVLTHHPSLILSPRITPRRNSQGLSQVTERSPVTIRPVDSGKLLEIWGKIIDSEQKGINLLDRLDRTYLCEGYLHVTRENCTVENYDKNMYCYLFDDVMLITELDSNKRLYRLQKAIKLSPEETLLSTEGDIHQSSLLFVIDDQNNQEKWKFRRIQQTSEGIAPKEGTEQDLGQWILYLSSSLSNSV